MQYELSTAAVRFLQVAWCKVQEKMMATSQRIGSSLPYIATAHHYTDVGERNLTWWTNGFWAGTLWQMYHATNKENYRQIAQEIEQRLDAAFDHFETLDHDVGFMWLNTAVTDYRLTNDQTARMRGLHAAEILAARYNPAGQYLLAWNGTAKQGQIIVDCFMNLPLLHWASHEIQDSRFAQIATHHAYTAAKTLLRLDGSVNHIAVFNPQNGEFIKNLGGQGYGEGSAWARGQAWAIYGLTLAFRDVHDDIFLNQAKTVANYFIANVALSNYVSLIDFRAPAQPIYRDTTATAIAICGLLELVKYLPADQQALYQQAAYKMFVALTENYCDFTPEHDELLTYGSAKYHRATDREVPIVYGDTFYLMALLRFLNLDLAIY